MCRKEYTHCVRVDEDREKIALSTTGRSRLCRLCRNFHVQSIFTLTWVQKEKYKTELYLYGRVLHRKYQSAPKKIGWINKFIDQCGKGSRNSPAHPAGWRKFHSRCRHTLHFSLYFFVQFCAKLLPFRVSFVFFLFCIAVADPRGRRPPTDPNFLNFMQFLGKSGEFVCWRPPRGWRSLLWGILYPPLYWISLISRIRWIQLESVKHDWKLFCVSHSHLALWCNVMTPENPGLGVQIQEFLLLERKA